MADKDEVAKLIAKLLAEVTGLEVEGVAVGGNLIDRVRSQVKRNEREWERYKGTKPLAEVKVTAKFKERFDALNVAAEELSKRMRKIERVFAEMTQEKSSLWEDICEEIEVDNENHFIHYDEAGQLFRVWRGKKDDDGKEEKKPKKRFVFDDDDE